MLEEIMVLLEVLWMMKHWLLPILLLLVGWALYEAVERKWEKGKKNKRRKQRMM